MKSYLETLGEELNLAKEEIERLNSALAEARNRAMEAEKEADSILEDKEHLIKDRNALEEKVRDLEMELKCTKADFAASEEELAELKKTIDKCETFDDDCDCFDLPNVFDFMSGEERKKIIANKEAKEKLLAEVNDHLERAATRRALLKEESVKISLQGLEDAEFAKLDIVFGKIEEIDNDNDEILNRAEARRDYAHEASRI